MFASASSAKVRDAASCAASLARHAVPDDPRPPLQPVGGHVLSHASATRIALRKGRADERIAKVVDSPDMPEGEASYRLGPGGWEDCS